MIQGLLHGSFTSRGGDTMDEKPLPEETAVPDPGLRDTSPKFVGKALTL